MMAPHGIRTVVLVVLDVVVSVLELVLVSSVTVLVVVVTVLVVVVFCGRVVVVVVDTSIVVDVVEVVVVVGKVPFDSKAPMSHFTPAPVAFNGRGKLVTHVCPVGQLLLVVQLVATVVEQWWGAPPHTCPVGQSVLIVQLVTADGTH